MYNTAYFTMAIQVTLLHNPTAGLGEHSKESLLQILSDKGYTVKYIDTKDDDYEAALNTPGDLVVVAGGDGTVVKVVPQLLQKRTPIGLLPLGTANNIATTLGIKGQPAELISRWSLSDTTPFDVGVAKCGENCFYFMESAGVGLFPRLISQHSKERKEPDNRRQELQEATAHVQQMLSSIEARHLKLLADGKPIEGNYFVAEVMNINLIGPNISLAPAAVPGDGFFDLVLVPGTAKEAFNSFISNGKRNAAQWQCKQAQQVTIQWQGTQYHTDDEVHEGSGQAQKLHISLIPAALQFLAP